MDEVLRSRSHLNCNRRFRGYLDDELELWSTERRLIRSPEAQRRENSGATFRFVWRTYPRPQIHPERGTTNHFENRDAGDPIQWFTPRFGVGWTMVLSFCLCLESSILYISPVSVEVMADMVGEQRVGWTKNTCGLVTSPFPSR
jgi:hypothetical protein